MSQRFQCTHRHEWNVAFDRDETASEPMRCPICNEFGSPAPTVNIENAQAESAALAATLPGGGVPLSPPKASGIPGSIAGYTILKELGRGGMGVVYLARQERLNRLVALKMVLSGQHAHENDRLRFLAEADAVARLQHPNIVQIYEIGEAEGRPFFSLEYVDGGNLAEHLNGTPSPPRDAAALCVLLARGIQAAHDAGIVHRDLKPANILLSAERGTRNAERSNDLRAPSSVFQIPKITDFGLAKQIDSAHGPTRTGDILGTPSYMAPEQAAGRLREIGPATDTYAIGAILYELITGRPPFVGATPIDTVMQVISEEPVKPTQLLPKCPRDLETICLKCLQKEPRKRYDSAGHLADDLQRFLNGEPIQARPVGPVERTWRWAKRNPKVAALLSLLAAVLIGGFAIVFGLWRKAEWRRQRADQQEARAKTNLLMAIDAVNRMMTRVADDKLAYVPQFEDERRQILEDAVSFYQGFSEQEQSDPTLRREIGRANFRLGKVFVGLGKTAKAQEAYRKALQYQEKLAADFPDDPGHHNDLALTLGDLALSLRIVGKTADADPLFERARSLAVELAGQHPTEVSFQETLAVTLQHYGMHLFQTRRIDDAERALRDSLAEFDRIVELRPNDFQFRLERTKARNSLAYFQMNLFRYQPAEETYRKAKTEVEELAHEFPEKIRDTEPVLANIQLNLASIYAATNRAAQAADLLRLGIATSEKLVADYPLSPIYRFYLARGYQTVSVTERAANHPTEAGQALSQAIGLLEKLGRDNPDAFYQTRLLRQCLHERSKILAEKGDYANAVADLDKALETLQSASAGSIAVNEAAPLRVEKSLVLARSKNHAAAVAAADAISGPSLTNPPTMYDLACVRAICSKLIHDDQTVPSTEREKRSDTQAEKALELLRTLRDRGYFKDAVRLRELMQDTDLDPLRPRADFRKFIEEFPGK